MQDSNYQFIAAHPQVRELFATFTTAQPTPENVALLATKSKPFRTALAIMANTDTQRAKAEAAHAELSYQYEGACDANDALCRELETAREARELVESVGASFNYEGEKKAQAKETKPRSDFQKGVAVLMDFLNGANKNFVNPEDTAEKEAEQKQQEEEETSSWKWWAIGGLVLLTGVFGYLTFFKKS